MKGDGLTSEVCFLASFMQFFLVFSEYLLRKYYISYYFIFPSKIFFRSFLPCAFLFSNLFSLGTYNFKINDNNNNRQAFPAMKKLEMNFLVRVGCHNNFLSHVYLTDYEIPSGTRRSPKFIHNYLKISNNYLKISIWMMMLVLG